MTQPAIPSTLAFVRFSAAWSGTWVLFALLGFSPTRAAGQPPAETDPVAAAVNGREITVGDVQYQIRLALGERAVDPAVLARLRAETLQKLVDRELVLLLLEERKLAATDEDIDLALARLTDELKARGRTLEEYLQQQSLTLAQFRRTLRWTISWKRMLDEYLTDQNLERYFEGHRRDFDGTRLHVAHILLKVGDDAKAVRQQAQQIREEIESGSITFAEGARKYSQAPTAEQGGDIGWIERHAPMPEAFSAAAFALEPMQVSEPVQSRFGVHLIQCLEVEPGQRQWQEVRRELESAVAKYLFSWAAERQRQAAQVEWREDVIPPPHKEQ